MLKKTIKLDFSLLTTLSSREETLLTLEEATETDSQLLKTNIIA